ncbi:MAG: WbqC family protein [Bacteroidetes bacterium]|nr:WbqC family protein [Bacteroidota bacterium]
MSIAILPSVYLGPVQYYQKLKNYDNCLIEHYEHLTKQTYRSRCDIYSPNGKLTLSIPIVHRNKRQIMKDVRISYEYNWQTLHWRSLESSYRRSPFFEYYEDDFRPYYHDKKFEFLIDLNEALQQEIVGLIKLKCNYQFTKEYQKDYSEATDYRTLISPKEPLQNDTHFELKPYYQVFEPRHGFIENLSILDLLFNQGSKTAEYL